MKITLAQLNPTVGDIDGNLSKIADALSRAAADASDLVVFPELFLVGYPPRDLLERSWFVKRVQEAIAKVADMSVSNPEIGIILGAPVVTGKTTGRGLYNAALLIHQGRIVTGQNKSLLPTYDVFDEARYFDPAPEIAVVPFKEEILGISICEDTWNDPELWTDRDYHFDPVQVLAQKGSTLLVNISASPFHVGKEETRYRIIKNHALRKGIPFAFVNQVGGNDELVFDGRSMCVDRSGNLLELFPPFDEQVRTVDMSLEGKAGRYTAQETIESVFQALVLGVRDYLRKCGFSKAVLGLSGGIDSAVTCCLAQAALGSENVLAVSMPGPYSSKGSIDDSLKLAGNLGVGFKKIPISEVYESYLASLKDHFKGTNVDITEENIQARIRGNILMAFSNKFGYLVLSTGNKSELAVGYCTLYGDMSGGLSVISDVPKTMVYELAQYINRENEIIPREIIDKAPSAELRPDQKDQDTLPPYPVLDGILQHYVNEGLSPKEIADKGYDLETVKWVIRAVNRNEYKRRQAALGLKITSKAFGSGRRMAIAAKYEV